VADAGAPTVYADTSFTGHYTFALVDLLIPYYVVDTTDPTSLVPGLLPNRTNRLHWWMDYVTQGDDGVFTGDCTLADYQGPQPPAGDIPHDYVLFLFNRPDDFQPIANALEYYDGATYNGDNRMNFSVTTLAAQVGNPIAARYFRVQRQTSTISSASSSTFTNTIASTTAVATTHSPAASALNGTGNATVTPCRRSVSSMAPYSNGSSGSSLPAVFFAFLAMTSLLRLL